MQISSIDHRRSQRIVLGVGITIRGITAGGEPISEAACTLDVNAHGALLPLAAGVELRQVLNVRHNQTAEEHFCTVARFSWNRAGRMEIGIEFVEPAPHFWQVASPPTDWL
jgi:hypothetical protein